MYESISLTSKLNNFKLKINQKRTPLSSLGSKQFKIFLSSFLLLNSSLQKCRSFRNFASVFELRLFDFRLYYNIKAHDFNDILMTVSVFVPTHEFTHITLRDYYTS